MAVLHRELPKESRGFLSALRFDERGIPMIDGVPAGIDGCYRFKAI